MSFFNKLKDRLFKSSSKLEEGLDAIVEDGGVEEDVIEEALDSSAADAAAQPEAEAKAAKAAEEAEAAAREAEAKAAAEAKVKAEAEEVEREAAELKAQAEAEAAAEEQAAAEAAKREAKALVEAKAKAEAEAAAAEEAAQEAADAVAKEAAEKAAAEAKAKAEQDRLEAEAKAAAEAEAARAKEAAEKAEAARLKAEEEAAEVARQAEDAAKAKAARQAEEAAKAAEAEAARVAAEEATKAAAKPGLIGRMFGRKAEAEPEVEATPEPTPEPQPEPSEEPATEPQSLKESLEVATELVEDTYEEAAKPGLLGRVLGRETPKKVIKRTLDDAMLESLEELLITADMGVETALRVTANIAEGRFGKKLSVAEIKELLCTEVTRIMEPVAKPMPLYPKTPQVVLVVGVNGSGKTTTIGKLALQFKEAGKSVVIAAGDTFRAAAVEQLQVWGERAGVPVLTAPEGSDPASLAFDAMTKAEEDGADLLMIDTAGRLQNRQDLMEELAKIVRVIRKKDESAPHNTLLVLDATTGQNAVNQVDVFQKISDVSGLVMTKLDGTAKGGVLVSLADKFGLPIHAIGVGEQIDDLQPFDPEDFARALTGYDG